MLSEVRELIRVREKAERDYNSAILQARMEEQEKAKEALEREKAKALQGKIESAKRFLEMGFPLEQVAQGTGLSIAELQKLQK